ncbi:40S ribosomal protein S15-like isoform 2 [Corchorus olitorius]|uniref:40S ribosomal protein S15-like isoform 2 n=1 Tax=Corchorus olitorius TaxID=93759 RepID=A0A1R3JT38_9ROSI|nr:40S ribosomal protein S15-like isoform 2 [Corchorus olitorius]
MTLIKKLCKAKREAPPGEKPEPDIMSDRPGRDH